MENAIKTESFWGEFVQTSERVLFLQGPIGPFFLNLRNHLEHAYGKEIFKINFNGGDSYYYHDIENTFDYLGTPEEFHNYLNDFIDRYEIDAIVCFGDGRIYHQIAKELVFAKNNTPSNNTEKQLTFWAFEEGYLRPHYITFEKWGVNYNSQICRKVKDQVFAIDWDRYTDHNVEPVAAGFWPRAKMAARYYYEMNKKRKEYPHYRHHRETRLSVYLYAWWIALLRGVQYKRRDDKIAQKMMAETFGDFFIFPLQVHNDSQILNHGKGGSIPSYIRKVIMSFAEYAPADAKLVIKHHPMDRGFNHYADLIKKLTERYDIEDRVFYVMEVPMPILLRAAKGMVVINSTSGISALIHRLPVKVIGDAHYDIEGLTAKIPLHDFWQKPQRGDEDKTRNYLNLIRAKSQLNGSFYYNDLNVIEMINPKDD